MLRAWSISRSKLEKFDSSLSRVSGKLMFPFLSAVLMDSINCISSPSNTVILSLPLKLYMLCVRNYPVIISSFSYNVKSIGIAQVLIIVMIISLRICIPSKPATL